MPAPTTATRRIPSQFDDLTVIIPFTLRGLSKMLSERSSMHISVLLTGQMDEYGICFPPMKREVGASMYDGDQPICVA